MGDPRRFNLFAELIVREFPQNRNNQVADVAGGKGYLKYSLYERRWKHVTTIDKRYKNSKGRLVAVTHDVEEQTLKM